MPPARRSRAEPRRRDPTPLDDAVFGQRGNRRNLDAWWEHLQAERPDVAEGVRVLSAAGGNLATLLTYTLELRALRGGRDLRRDALTKIHDAIAGAHEALKMLESSQLGILLRVEHQQLRAQVGVLDAKLSRALAGARKRKENIAQTATMVALVAHVKHETGSFHDKWVSLLVEAGTGTPRDTDLHSAWRHRHSKQIAVILARERKLAALRAELPEFDYDRPDQEPAPEDDP